jgi:predicted nucleic acid-binding protein
MNGFFLDTYAIIEFLRRNARYRGYFKGGGLFTSVVNLAELYFVVLRERGGAAADETYGAFRHLQTEVTDADIKKGMLLRIRLRSKDVHLSCADAIGYAMAERLNVKFLNGDSAFKGMPIVEFVK